VDQSVEIVDLFFHRFFFNVFIATPDLNELTLGV